MVIYFWEEPEIHLNEIRRVLKPGGRFYTGMRTKASMQAFPFTKYGFNLYTVDEWSSVFNNNGFNVSQTLRKNDPAFDDFEQTVQLESVFIETQNPVEEWSCFI
jgi:SAM-dependent methyltransferase